MIQKKSFVLLELLIAFALISLSVLPFIHFPHSHIQQETNTLFLTQLEDKMEEELALMYLALYETSSKEKIPLSLSPSQEIALHMRDLIFNDELSKKHPCKKHPWSQEMMTLSLPGSAHATKNFLLKRSLFCKKQELSLKDEPLAFVLLRVSVYEKRGIKPSRFKQICSADLKVMLKGEKLLLSNT